MSTLPITDEIAKLKKEIVTTGMEQFRSSNIEKQKRLNELIRKSSENSE